MPEREPTAAPTRPTREQDDPVRVELREPGGTWYPFRYFVERFHVPGYVECRVVIDEAWQVVRTDNEHVPSDDGAVYIAERWRPSALLAGEGTAQPEPDDGHHAIIDVRWQPSASVGEFDAVERLMLHMSGEITDLLDQWCVTEANVQCDMHANGRASGEGTAPQVPAEVLWEGETGYFELDRLTESHVDWLRLPVPPRTRVRVVAADGAPQEQRCSNSISGHCMALTEGGERPCSPGDCMYDPGDGAPQPEADDHG